MVRLIDADLAIDAIRTKNGIMPPQARMDTLSAMRFGAWIAENIVDSQPTIDAEPVRHGHWIFNPKDAIEMMYTLPKCSECGAESADGGYYCSNCGARMDGGDNENN